MSHVYAAARSEPSVGALLTSWRKTRQLSQLALALEAGVSSRHLCFVETGRAKPSRDMILLLAETLDVSLHERNAPQGVTAQEIRLECFFPANQATAERARSDFGR